ncbi:MAG: 50S ribosomal protein L28 [Patescibacteria group bacterium]
MAKMCEICGRQAIIGNSRSHSHIANRRRMNINLQRKKLAGQKLMVCTSCLKTLNKLAKQAKV